ncbi:hypothetical protein C4J93_4085 [Pseudomonas sp. R2-37-08W]|nr:hypothetical protein C4J93_4085 [Pseudomonas sp. R2-37-08W]
MGSTSDKVKGVANEAAGNIKQGVGKATDNDKMRAEGVIQEKKGEAQQAVGKTKDAVKKRPSKTVRLAHPSSPTAIYGWPFLYPRLQLKFRNCFKVAKWATLM